MAQEPVGGRYVRNCWKAVSQSWYLEQSEATPCQSGFLNVHALTASAFLF
jgi:hypothetical protein